MRSSRWFLLCAFFGCFVAMLCQLGTNGGKMAATFWQEGKVSGTTLIPWVFPATLSRYDILREGSLSLSTEVARAAPFQEAAQKARKLAWAGARQEIVTWDSGIGKG